MSCIINPRIICLTILSGIVLLISPKCFSQTDEAYSDTIRLEDIVIVGNRFETSLSDRPEAISVMNIRQLKTLSPMSMPDVMSAMPGVFMQKTNHGGGSPFVRGLTGYHTLIMVDGVRLNNAIFRSGPNQYLNTVDPLMIDQIEVLRGPGSVEYGTDAIGGTIYLRSKEPQFSDNELQVNGNLYAKWLSHHMEKSGRAELQLATQKFALLAGITRKDFGNIVAGEGLGELDYTSYDEYSTDLKARYKLDSSQILSIAWQHHKQNDVQLYHKLITGDYSTYEFDPQQRDLIYLRHELTRDNSVINGFRSTVSMHQSDEIRKKQKTGSEDFFTEHDMVRSYGFTFEGMTEIGSNWEGVTGFEAYYDRVSSSALKTNLTSGNDSTLRGLYPEKSSICNLSLFSLHTIKIKKFELNGGIRYNHFLLRLTDELFSDLSLNPSALVGTIGASYRIFPNTEISFRINNAFRAPNINDVSSFGIADFRYEIPNIDLAPEKSWNKELGIKTNQKYFSGALHLYQNNLTNLITNVKTTFMGQDSIDGIKVYTRENAGEAFLKGMEGQLQLRPLRHFTINSYLVYTYGQNVTRNEPLRRIPPLTGLIGLHWSMTRNFEIITEWQFAGKQERLSSGDMDDSRIPEGGTPAWSLFNCRFSYRIAGFHINSGLLNIFNEAYKTHGSGVDGIGRSLYISLRYTF